MTVKTTTHSGVAISAAPRLGTGTPSESAATIVGVLNIAIKSKADPLHTLINVNNVTGVTIRLSGIRQA